MQTQQENKHQGGRGGGGGGDGDGDRDRDDGEAERLRAREKVLSESLVKEFNKKKRTRCGLTFLFLFQLFFSAPSGDYCCNESQRYTLDLRKIVLGRLPSPIFPLWDGWLVQSSGTRYMTCRMRLSQSRQILLPKETSYRKDSKNPKTRNGDVQNLFFFLRQTSSLRPC